MRSDYPDYKTPIFAMFRALGAWTLVVVAVGAGCVIFDASGWVVNGLFIALGAAGLVIALVSPLGVVREENRANRARGGQAGSVPLPPSSRWTRNLRLVIATAGLLGLPLLAAGLIARVTSLEVAGGALVVLVLTDTGLIYPAIQARRTARRRGGTKPHQPPR